VIRIGPGYAIPNPNYTDDEPWSSPKDPIRYIPLQVQEGDYAIFLREQAVEVNSREKSTSSFPSPPSSWSSGTGCAKNNPPAVSFRFQKGQRILSSEFRFL
jgi:hypothetical protein